MSGGLLHDLAWVVGVAAVAGWLCRRAGLSPVLGYLVAGVVLGPTFGWAAVGDAASVGSLAQIGLVFLMFSIGMRLGLRRLRELGLPLVLAAALGAVFVYNVVRAVGFVAGLSSAETLVLAGMLMVSSSAVIAKVLADLGLSLKPHGQRALGITVLEDVVAVVVLTLAVPLLGPGEVQAASVGRTLGVLAAFVILAVVVGLLVVPYLLRRLGVEGGAETRTLVAGGLLFLLAVLAAEAGYSPALGAFLLGVVVAETEQRVAIERSLEGVRDLFSAVFFAAMGMLLDGEALLQSWPWLVGGVVLALVVRPMAVTVSLVLLGARPAEAWRTGFLVTPIGEFSLVLAQVAVAAGAVGPEVQASAVGIAVLTALVAPVLARRAESWGEVLAPREGGALWSLLEVYRGLLERLQRVRERSLAWRLVRGRLLQLGVQVLLVVGVLVFAPQFGGPLAALVERVVPWGGEPLFWFVVLLVVAVPLYAAWRNFSAVTMILAEATTAGLPRERFLRPIAERGMQLAGALGLANAVVGAVAAGGWPSYVAPLLAVSFVLAVVVAGRRLVHVHAEAELALRSVLEPGEAAGPAPWLEMHADWGLELLAVTVPDQAHVAGRTLREVALRTQTGCSVVEIDRGGFLLCNPGPGESLFPGDRVVLLGEPAALPRAAALLQRVSVEGSAPVSVERLLLETVAVTAGSPFEGRTLAELALSQRTGVVAVALRRSGKVWAGVPAQERLQAGDELLVLGTRVQVDALRAWCGG